MSEDKMMTAAQVPVPAPEATQVLTIGLEREVDGRWIGEVLELPGCLVYGQSPGDAANKVKALAHRVLAERMENAPTNEISAADEVVRFRFGLAQGKRGHMTLAEAISAVQSAIGDSVPEAFALLVELAEEGENARARSGDGVG